MFSGTNNKFPTYSGEVFKKDSLEDVTTKALVELLKQYDLPKLESVRADFTNERERPLESGG
jgi:hypothetical protein